jgi:hypothetical protein
VSSSLPSRGAKPHLPDGVTVSAPREGFILEVERHARSEPRPAQQLHGIAAHCTLIDCTCGEVLAGETEADALLVWEQHALDALS